MTRQTRPKTFALLVIIAATAVGGRSTWVTAQTAENADRIAAGRRLFTRIWTVREGLGPTINARSCAGCHANPEVGGSGTDARSLVAIALGVVDPTGGHVFRRLRVSETGAVTEQAAPIGGVLRKAPALFGSGLIETVPEVQITKGADSTEAAAGGISGRVPGGRFGWKGRFRNIEEVVAAAFANELGLGSSRYPDPLANRGAEVSPEQIHAVSAFIRALPPRLGQPRAGPPQGREIFDGIGCSACHSPSFITFSGREIFPYTDLLLHDMGPALADAIEEGNAGVSEFKTPPLWGIGRTGPPYLHDGRAKSVHEAIAAHGGEAASSATEYGRLSSIEKGALLAFLRSL